MAKPRQRSPPAPCPGRRWLLSLGALDVDLGEHRGEVRGELRRAPVRDNAGRNERAVDCDVPVLGDGPRWVVQRFTAAIVAQHEDRWARPLASLGANKLEIPEVLELVDDPLAL